MFFHAIPPQPYHTVLYPATITFICIQIFIILLFGKWNNNYFVMWKCLSVRVFVCDYYRFPQSYFISLGILVPSENNLTSHTTHKYVFISCWIIRKIWKYCWEINRIVQFELLARLCGLGVEIHRAERKMQC